MSVYFKRYIYILNATYVPVTNIITGQKWEWALRGTPILGAFAVILILFFLKDRMTFFSMLCAHVL